jgi:aspartate 1-decarboxylase
MSFCQLTTEELDTHRPKVVILDAHNRVEQTLTYPER